MIGYIIIGIFASIVVYIAILYFVNSKKMKNKAQKSVEKAKQALRDEPKKDVEVESSMSGKTPIEIAIMEENSKINKTEIEQAFLRIEDQRLEYEKYVGNKNKRNGKYLTELEQSLENDSTGFYRTKHMSSETAIIGREGPSKESIDRVNQEISKENISQDEIDRSLANEINNLSPELKAVLLNDILSKKY